MITRSLPVLGAPKKSRKRSAKKAPVSRVRTKRTTKISKVEKLPHESAKAASLPDAPKLPVYIHAPVQKREPLGHLLAEKKLKEAGFRGSVSTDKHMLDAYSNDESIFTIRPQIVLQPFNQKDVEIAVSVLSKETQRFPSLSLTPRAAGTGLGGGSLTDSVVVDVRKHLNRIGAIEKKEGALTITCEPGALWRDVEKKLRSHGVYIPSFPASKDICTMGGAVANNAAGPDSLRYGHTARFVMSVDMTLYDGKTYTFKPITYKEFKTLSKKQDAYGRILSEIFTLIEEHEKAIQSAKPKTSKNTSGYALWDVNQCPVSSFKKGKGVMDLTQLICGSQGTLGIITSITFRTVPIEKHTQLIAVPVFDLHDGGKVIQKALEYDPLNIELFDGLSFDLAMQHPTFFKQRLGKLEYYQVLLSLYTTFHVRYARKIPEFTLLITLDPKSRKHNVKHIVEALRRSGGRRARVVTSAAEQEMLWQVRRASYSLSKLMDPNKRPAAFLEDMVVPPKHLPKFFMEIKRLLKKYNLTAAIHGHGGDGHLHFYPLLDFENKTTPTLIMRMTEEFFAIAEKYEGNLCGEHNDGIIRTPHIGKMFSARIISLFERVENIFDPNDIFNPGKKVHPRFDIKGSIRMTNANVLYKN